MRYETCSQGITLRGIRRAFRDELNGNPAIRDKFDEACGGGMIQSFDGAVMKNQGDDLRFITRTTRGTDGFVWVDVQLDRILGLRPITGVIDLENEPQVRANSNGDIRRITAAPQMWFRHTANAQRSVNRLDFESLMPLASPKFLAALEEGVQRAGASFRRMLAPPKTIPYWVARRR